MTRRVSVRSPAETDLIDSALFIAEDNPAAAERFLDEAEKAFARLAEFPEIGTPRTAFDPALAGLRLWPVPGFAKFRICYIPRADHIDVLRVLHGALGPSFAPPLLERRRVAYTWLMKTTRRLTAIIEREDDAYVALCPELDIASQGDTVESARKNLVEALELFFESADASEIARRLRGEVFVTQIEVLVR